MNTTKEKIANSDSFCVMPWVHLHVATNGDVNACCLVSKPFGNINTESIKGIWDGHEINKFRDKLLNNIKDERCNLCYSKETSGGRSLRQDSNHTYMQHFLQITSSSKDENSSSARPVYWDIRLSNVCNFRCRTCYHGASSRWFDEAVKLGETVSGKPITRAADDLEEFFLHIEDWIDSVEEIYFAGGEPLVMEEHYRILNILRRRNGFDKRLRYNTNFSTFKFKQNDVFEIWSKFSKVSVNASLDAWGKRGEFLRKEQRWSEVINSRELMKTICPNVGFIVSATVSVFNIFHLPDFHKQLVFEKHIRVDEFYIGNILQTPKYYSIQILPFDFKLKIKKKFEDHMEWIRSQVFENAFAKEMLLFQFTNCINYLFALDLSENIPKFVSRCNMLDQWRGEKTAEVFPELEFLFQSPYQITS